MKHKLLSILAIGLLAGPMAAQAATYDYQMFDYPGATLTQVFGVNASGQVVGNGFDPGGGQLAAFIYDSKSGSFTVVSPLAGYSRTAVTGINVAGVTVGSVFSLDGLTESGFIRATDGTYTVFAHPGWDNTEARGIGTTGLVTGFSTNADFTSFVSFIYDPKRNTFIDLLPSTRFGTAQGINTRGDVVGNVFLLPDQAYPGSPVGQYGWLRAKNGSMTFFRVNGLQTRARGINDMGLITGFVNDPGGDITGFATQLTGTSGYQAISIPNADLLKAPGSTVTFPEGSNNAGTIVGSTADEFGGGRAFFATRR